MTATTIEITAQTALNLLEQAVEERGADYRYDTDAAHDRALRLGFEEGSGPGCYYWHDDEPGCIAGLVLHEAGVPDDTLRAMDLASKNDGLPGTSIEIMGGWLYQRGINTTHEARRVLRAAQTAQDRGCTWGEALTEARTRAAGL